MRYGAAKKASARLTGQLDAVLAAIVVLAVESPCDLTYGRLRATLEKGRHLVSDNDLLIAAQALTLGYTIVTDNERIFADQSASVGIGYDHLERVHRPAENRLRSAGNSVESLRKILIHQKTRFHPLLDP